MFTGPKFPSFMLNVKSSLAADTCRMCKHFLYRMFMPGWNEIYLSKYTRQKGIIEQGVLSGNLTS